MEVVYTACGIKEGLHTLDDSEQYAVDVWFADIEASWAEWPYAYSTCYDTRTEMLPNAKQYAL